MTKAKTIVLVIDDGAAPDVVDDALSLIKKRNNCRLIRAADITRGLTKIRVNKIDLILLNRTALAEFGLEALHTITTKAGPHSRPYPQLEAPARSLTPVVFLTVPLSTERPAFATIAPLGACLLHLRPNPVDWTL